MKTAREIIETYDGPKVRIMEVCGTHTHEIFRLGIRKLLPKQVELISGPGCPVCVTPVSFIDEAIYLALEKDVTICTFGDLVRVPGTKMSLAGAREQGAKIHVVYSPADAEKYAKEHSEEQVTFLSVGFETTTPAGCLSVKAAREDHLDNYSILVANKTMPQAYEKLKNSADVFLYPGHVNAITGTRLCEDLTKEGISGVVAGFTAKELLTALAVSLVKFQEGKPFFVNCYPRVVTRDGSKEAQVLVDEMMEACVPVDNYYYEGKRTAVFLGEKVTKYHRTLTTYLNTLLSNGFIINQIVEPQPPENMMDIPGMQDEMRRPMMLIISANKKMDR